MVVSAKKLLTFRRVWMSPKQINAFIWANWPPTPPLTQHQSTDTDLGWMWDQGRGRCTVCSDTGIDPLKLWTTEITSERLPRQECSAQVRSARHHSWVFYRQQPARSSEWLCEPCVTSSLLPNVSRVTMPAVYPFQARRYGPMPAADTR